MEGQGTTQHTSHRAESWGARHSGHKQEPWPLGWSPGCSWPHHLGRALSVNTPLAQAQVRFSSYQDHFKDQWDQFALFHKSVKKKKKTKQPLIRENIYLNQCPDIAHDTPMLNCWNSGLRNSRIKYLFLIHWATAINKKYEAFSRATARFALLIITKWSIK